MKVQATARTEVSMLTVLGSSGAAEPGRGSTAFLVGDALAVDGGSLASGMPLEAQRKVRTVLLTHHHFDHLRELPLFLDNVYAARMPPVAVGAEESVLRTLFRDVFNGRLWPDLRKFRRPPARFFAVRPGAAFTRAGLRIVPLRLRHPAPCVGYVFRKGKSAAAVLGDTGWSMEVFRALAAVEGLRTMTIECSYPARMEDLAEKAGHLTSEGLQSGLCILRERHPGLRVIATHIKPPWAGETEEELGRITPEVHVARDGARYPMFTG